MLFIIPCINNATTIRIIENAAAERKQNSRRGDGLGKGLGRASAVTAISHPRDLYRGGRGRAGRGEVFQLNADYIALSLY